MPSVFTYNEEISYFTPSKMFNWNKFNLVAIEHELYFTADQISSLLDRSRKRIMISINKLLDETNEKTLVIESGSLRNVVFETSNLKIGKVEQLYNINMFEAMVRSLSAKNRRNKLLEWIADINREFYNCIRDELHEMYDNSGIKCVSIPVNIPFNHALPITHTMIEYSQINVTNLFGTKYLTRYQVHKLTGLDERLLEKYIYLTYAEINRENNKWIDISIVPIHGTTESPSQFGRMNSVSHIYYNSSVITKVLQLMETKPWLAESVRLPIMDIAACTNFNLHSEPNVDAYKWLIDRLISGYMPVNAGAISEYLKLDLVLNTDGECKPTTEFMNIASKIRECLNDIYHASVEVATLYFILCISQSVRYNQMIDADKMSIYAMFKTLISAVRRMAKYMEYCECNTQVDKINNELIPWLTDQMNGFN